MAVDVEINVGLLRSEIKNTYAAVSEEPGRDFIFPTGRAWAEDLGYPAELANVPESAVQSFAGVANPFSVGRLAPGGRLQIADVTIQNPVSEEGRRNIDLWTG